MENISKVTRQSNFELLRIVAILMIVSMHLMGEMMQSRSLVNRELIVFFNAAFNVSTSLFILISGYFGLHFKKEKLIHLWILTLSYSLLVLLLNCFVLKTEPLGGKMLIHSLFPVFTKSKWFITCYIILYILSPYVNKGIETLSQKQFVRLILIFVVFFYFAPTVLFLQIMNDSGKGIINMLTVYLIGRYIAMYGIHSKWLSWKMGGVILLVIFLANSLFTYGLHHISGYYSLDCSLFILVLSIIVFCHAKQWKFSSSFVNRLATYCFPIYLFSDVFVKLGSPWLKEYQDSYICWALLLGLLVGAVCFTVIVEKLRSCVFSRSEEKIILWKILKIEWWMDKFHVVKFGLTS